MPRIDAGIRPPVATSPPPPSPRQVLGDPLYGDANWNRLEARTARRPLLHARELRLAHPHSGELLHAVAPAPDDLAAYGARLAGVSPDRFDAWAREATDAVLAEARDSFEYC